MNEPLRPLYDLPPNIGPVDAVRGSILVLDGRALRESKIFEAYQQALEPDARESLATVTAGSWVPIDLLQAHYRALDSLALESGPIGQIGEAVGSGVHGAFLLTLIRLAGAMGVSPWLALEQSYKLWVRSWRGGAIAVHRAGNQAAQVRLQQVGVCGSRFFRLSFAGALRAGIGPFCKKPHAAEQPSTGSSSSVTYRVSWS